MNLSRRFVLSGAIALSLFLGGLGAAESAEAPEVKRLAKDLTPSDKVTIGEAEYVGIPLIDAVFKARIDTGATTTSIYAVDIEEFERDGKPWVRFVVKNDESKEEYPLEARVARVAEIKKRGEEGFTRRPAVSMDLVLGEATRSIKVNLADRSGFEFPLLIGRDFLSGIAVVDVTLSYTQKTPGSPKAEEGKKK